MEGGPSAEAHAVSGATPVEKETTQLFFDLPKFEPLLREWTRSGSLQEGVANKLQEWFEAGLNEWDISRDAPYFGFEIPDEFVDTSHAMDVAVYKLQARNPAPRLKTDETLVEASACVRVPVACG